MSEALLAIPGRLGTLRGIRHPPIGADRGWSVIVLQGYFSSTHVGPARLYVQLSRCLARLGVEVLRVDPFGVGDSDGDFARTSYRSELDDYRTVLGWCRARGPRRVALLGHCLGASMAVRLAAEDPGIEHLSLISPALGPITYLDRLLSPEQLLELGRRAETVRKATTIHQPFLQALQRDDVFGLSRRISAEIVIFLAPRDQYFDRSGADRLLAAAPAARLVEVEGADHNYVTPGARARLLACFEVEAARWTRGRS